MRMPDSVAVQMANIRWYPVLQCSCSTAGFAVIGSSSSSLASQMQLLLSQVILRSDVTSYA